MQWKLLVARTAFPNFGPRGCTSQRCAHLLDEGAAERRHQVLREHHFTKLDLLLCELHILNLQR